MSNIDKITSLLGLTHKQVIAVLDLLAGGNTIPFIARYRKELTGSLDEEVLRKIQAINEKLRSLDERRKTVIKSIEEQGKLTEILLIKINETETLSALEDLYQPYKPKRRTRASIARDKGLQGLADLIISQGKSVGDVSDIAREFLNENINNVVEALAGARDIVAEIISDFADVRRIAREKALQFGIIHCRKKQDAIDERNVYQSYYEFDQRVDRIRPHQTLAIDRGEKGKVLSVSLEVTERDWRMAIGSSFHPDRKSIFFDQLCMAIEDSAQRLLLPSIERDIRRILTEQAEKHAIAVFGKNLRALLSQRPLSGRIVMGIDPGFRTGCKIAVIDETGKLLDTATVYPNEPHKKTAEAFELIKKQIASHDVSLIAIGNGTASRETESFIAELTRSNIKINYVIVSEAGASVYSASSVARSEFPNLDVSMRGAVSIARRVLDPLSELVKVEPQSIGVGLYQHDVNQTDLEQSLNGVVEDVVNRVGVNINIASPSLLKHVSGIGPKLADSIVSFRNENGAFINRDQLHLIPGMGAKAFEQSAGFLRIQGGNNPLDASAIHPESYPVTEKIFKMCNINQNMPKEAIREALQELTKADSIENLAYILNTDRMTLVDIFEQIVQPERDPRNSLPAPILRSDITSIDDLKKGVVLKGTVRNVVDFGAFVDIGVKQAGLLHRTQMPPGTIVQVGDVIDVEILSVETERERIALRYASMI